MLTHCWLVLHRKDSVNNKYQPLFRWVVEVSSLIIVSLSIESVIMDNFFNTAYRKLFFILALGLFFQACENDQVKIAQITKPDQLPLESLAGLETIYSDSGIIKVKVIAPVLNKYNNPKLITEMPIGIAIEFYDNNLHVISKLTSHYAVHYEQDRKWMAKNDVVVVNTKGERLNTEKLFWNENSGKIYSDEFVKITTPEEIIMGKGFEAEQDFSKYKIFKVTGNITVKK